MRTFQSTLLVAALSTTEVLGDFLGPSYPAPRDLTSNNSLVQAAWKNVSAVFDAYLKNGINSTAAKGIVGTQNVTFSAGMLSVYDEAASGLQYHYTAPQVANAAEGTRNVDGDSVYRVASVSKLCTVYAGMIGITEEDWMSPVTKFIPELTQNLESANAPDWDGITLWALASHLAGIQIIGPLSDLVVSFEGNATEETATGLPPKGLDTLGPCYGNNCTIADFILSYRSGPPAFPVHQVPAYSNFGMMVLGQAISRIVKKPYGALYEDLLFGPLGMTSSFANPPTTGDIFPSRAVIPGPIEYTWAAADNVFTLPSGGILSSINDLSKLGISILNNTFLSASETRKWMKPHSHTASLTYSMGAPWEIVRYTHKSTGKVTDIYGKLGDSGAYGALVALIPDYDAGFTFANAFWEPPPAATRGDLAMKLINEIAEAVIPALEAQAAAEARKNFAGSYVPADGNNINSSLTLSSDPGTLGLVISSWISNGSDIPSQLYTGKTPARIFPTNTSLCADGGEITFQTSTVPQYPSYEAAKLGPYTGLYGSNFGTFVYDGDRYALRSLSTWRFEVDETGAAKSVTNDALGLKMVRKS